MQHVPNHEIGDKCPVEWAVRTAAKSAGGLTALGVAVGIAGTSPCNVVWAWVDRGRVPPEHCHGVAKIGSARGVRIWHLRPNDWWRVWPYLLRAKGHPEPGKPVPIPVDDALATQPGELAEVSHG